MCDYCATKAEIGQLTYQVKLMNARLELLEKITEGVRKSLLYSYVELDEEKDQ